MSKDTGINFPPESVPLLRVRDLRVGFPGQDPKGDSTEILKGVDLEIGPGQSVALIGDSGSGKSMTALAICGLLPATAHWEGEICWKGRRLEDPRGTPWREVRGSGVGLIMQEPAQCLNPVVTVGRQIAESLMWHKGLSKTEARLGAIALLKEVQVPDPHLRAEFYPHQLSGGMCQRVLVAAALACDPELLIADEPTTSLDPTVQKEIILLLQKIISDRAMAMLFITHDYDLVPVLAQQIAMIKDGRIVSLLKTDDCSLSAAGDACEALSMANVNETTPVLVAQGVSVIFEDHDKSPVAAVQSVDLELFKGQALGLAGESGCGKTTLARVLSGHLPPGSGIVEFPGRTDFYGLTGWKRRNARRKVQLMFQNAAGSLNPRQRVGQALKEAAGGVDYCVNEALQEVGLASDLQGRYPHELSGGQRQRVALARVLACNPDVLVADEPTTALDPTARIKVLDLLSAIMKARDLAMLIISHDLKVLHSFCARVALMYGGYVVEVYRPQAEHGSRHPYGMKLWSSQPGLWPNESGKVFGRRNGGEVLSLSKEKGCPYANECSLCKPLCEKELPTLKSYGAGELLRCPVVGL